MRRPRVQFTVRRMMVVVAAVSLILGMTAGLIRRRASFRRQAEDYARRASREYMMGMIAGQVPWFAGARPSAMQVRMQEAHNDLGDHYTALGEKSRRAADSPWLPVGTDPSPPPWPNGVPYEVPR